MTEYKVELRNLAKDAGSEIIISDEQIDEDGNVVKEPVIVFAKGGERAGYISVIGLTSWIMHHTYAPELKLLNQPRRFHAAYE